MLIFDFYFSNHDALVQLLSVIKQIIAIEASLCYIRKRYEFKELDNDDQKLILENLRNIRNMIKLCAKRNKMLTEKVENVSLLIYANCFYLLLFLSFKCSSGISKRGLWIS